MKKGTTYKHSGIPWLGDVPAHWEVVRLEHIAEQRKRINKNCDEMNVLSLSYGQIKRRKLDNFGLLPASYSTYNVIQEGDIVLRLTDLQNDHVSLRVGHAKEKGIITSAYCTLIPKLADSNYLYYLLASFDFKKGFYGLAGGVRQSLTFDSIRTLKFPLPPLTEQRAIAAFLDQKTAQLDGAIESVERSLELLRELRAATISEAVTRGLKANTPLRDSGVPWIGKVPEHWVISKVRYTFNNRDSERVPIEASLRKQTEDSIYPYYGATGIVDKVDGYLFDKPLILIGEDGANLKLRNLPLIYVPTGRYWVNNHAHILEPNDDVCLQYAAYQLESADYNCYLTGTTMPKLTQENLDRVPFALPPLAEQQEIARYLDEKTAKIDSLVSAKQRQVQLLRELRASVIAEAVTGKLGIGE